MVSFLQKHNKMRIFISYSRKDGIITNEILSKLEKKLSNKYTTFIHCLKEKEIKFQQTTVIYNLIISEKFILIESPASKKSKWVKLEVFLARLFFIPIKKIPAVEIIKIIKED